MLNIEKDVRGLGSTMSTGRATRSATPSWQAYNIATNVGLRSPKDVTMVQKIIDAETSKVYSDPAYKAAMDAAAARPKVYKDSAGNLITAAQYNTLLDLQKSRAYEQSLKNAAAGTPSSDPSRYTKISSTEYRSPSGEIVTAAMRQYLMERYKFANPEARVAKERQDTVAFQQAQVTDSLVKQGYGTAQARSIATGQPAPVATAAPAITTKRTVLRLGQKPLNGLGVGSTGSLFFSLASIAAVYYLFLRK